MVFFNTREDVYNSLEIDINATVATLKDILNDRFKWQVVKVLLTKEEGIEDETHLIIESENEIANFSLGSNKIYKLDLKKDSRNYEYVYTKNPVKAINGVLYATTIGFLLE